MSTGRPLHLALTVGVALLVVAAGEHWAERLTAGAAAPKTGLQRDFQRRENVRVLPREPADLPPPEAGPRALLIGNSHTYTLPGLNKGHPLRPDPGITLIDELEKHTREFGEATFYRLSYPNFLPFEILTRYGQLSLEGHRPSVVVFGLTWRNIARDRKLRHQVHRTFEDDAFAAAFRERLASPEIDAEARVREAVEAELRQVAFDRQQQRQRSAADRLDEHLTEAAGEHVALVGRSADLRARIYRELAYGIEDLLVHEETQEFSYDAVEEDLAFNRFCLEALFRWLHDDGARVILYRAPRRADLPPLVDPAREDEVMRDILDRGEALGFVTIDARDAVPSELWGWERNTPDRSHFTEPGHELLAERLVRAAEAHGIWSALAAERLDGGADALQ